MEPSSVPFHRPALARLLAGILVLAALPAAGAQTPAIPPAAQTPEIFVQLGHTSAATCVAASPDGKRVLSGGSDKTAVLWDLPTGKEIRTLPQQDRVEAVAVSPDSTLGLVGAARQGPALYRMDTGDLVRRFGDGAGVGRVCAFLAGGAQVLAMNGSRALEVWDTATGARLRTFQDPFPDEVDGFALSPDGRYAAVGGWGKTVALWDAAAGRRIALLDDGFVAVSALAFSPDGRTLLAGGRTSGYKGQATLWQVPDGKRVWRARGKEVLPDIRAAAFTPDGRRILLAQINPRALDAATGKDLGCPYPTDHEQFPETFAFAPDGRSLLATDQRDIQVLDPATLALRSTLTGDTASSRHLAVDRATGRILVLHDFMPMDIWDPGTGARIGRLEGETGNDPTGAWLPGGRTVAGVVRARNHNLSFWDPATGKWLGAFPDDHKSPIDALAVSPDGRFAATGGDWLGAEPPDTDIRIWDVAQGRLLRRLPGSARSGTDLAFSPDGSLLLALVWPGEPGVGQVVMYEVASGRALWRYKIEEFAARVAFAPDGSWCLTAGLSKHLAVHDPRTGAVLRSVDTSSQDWSGEVVSISPDGRTLLAGGMHGLALLDAATLRPLRTFAAHGEWAQQLAFSPDGRLAIMATLGGTVRIWETATARELASLVTFKDGEWIAVTPEGYFACSARGDAHLNVRLGSRVVGIEAYREALYRPDLVQASLAGQPLGEFRSIAQIKPAPLVSLVQVPARVDQEALEVKVRLADQGGGIGDLRLFLNGTAVLLDQARGLQVRPGGDGLRGFTVRLAPGPNTLRAVAFNADNSMSAESEPAQVEAAIQRVRKPRLHALVVGIQTFRNPNLALRYPVADANAFADTLQRVSGRLFDQVQVQRLTTPEQTSRDALRDAFRGFQGLDPEDTFLFFVASHGTVDDGEYFLLTSNVGATSTQRLRSDALSQADLKDLIANVPCTKKLVFLDTCSAGALGSELQKTLLTRGMSEQSAVNVLSRAVGSTILSASTSAQEALEGYQGHGLFTYVLTQGLQGKAARAPGDFIRTTELATYVEDQVPALAEQVFHRAQFPTVCISGQGFPIGKGD